MVYLSAKMPSKLSHRALSKGVTRLFLLLLMGAVYAGSLAHNFHHHEERAAKGHAHTLACLFESTVPQQGNQPDHGIATPCFACHLQGSTRFVLAAPLYSLLGNIAFNSRSFAIESVSVPLLPFFFEASSPRAPPA